MITVVSGTNRKDSISMHVARYCVDVLEKSGVGVSLMDLSRLPEDFIFTALYDETGKNEIFNQFQKTISASEKFVFIVPEYNGSFPGVLKAFMDGLQYPESFRYKKAALVGLSAGTQGAILALSHLTDIFNYLGMHVLAQKVRLYKIDENFSDGKIINKDYLAHLDRQAALFVDF